MKNSTAIPSGADFRRPTSATARASLLRLIYFLSCGNLSRPEKRLYQRTLPADN
jgi:hypothetical protein